MSHIENRTSTLSQDEAMWRDTKKLLPWFIPIMVFTIIMGVIGIAGNIVTFLFFHRWTKHSSTTVLVAGLAVVDMVVCVLSFTTVADMLAIIMHVELNSEICKTMYPFANWVVGSSTFILWTISVDRYIKMCQPQWNHFCTIRKAYVAIGIFVFIAFVGSARKIFIYDMVVVPFTADGDISRDITNASFVRYVCSTTELSLSTGLNVAEAIIGISVVFTFVFSYGNILNTLFKHNKTRVALGINTTADSNADKTKQSVALQTESSDFIRSQYSTNDGCSNVETINDTPIKLQSIAENDPESSQAGTETSNFQITAPLSRTVYQKDTGKPTQPSSKLNKIQQSERIVTIMMLAVTIGFFVCFVPYFAICLGMPSDNPGKQKLDGPIQFAFRSPFWNSVINPILYYVIDPRYRQYVKNIISQA